MSIACERQPKLFSRIYFFFEFSDFCNLNLQTFSHSEIKFVVHKLCIKLYNVFFWKITLLRHSFIHLHTWFVTCNLCEIVLRACVSLVWGYFCLVRSFARRLSFQSHPSGSVFILFCHSSPAAVLVPAISNKWKCEQARATIYYNRNEYRKFFVCCCTILILMRALALSPLALSFHLGESHKMYIIGWMLSRAASLPLYRETHISSYYPLNESTHIRASKKKKHK